ncbi:purine nucleoside permease [Paraburkholderia silvatlantica]|uniref:Purine nucleoside permease n=1 Tax=Paraburkholderia silvatlantica TaxID=321895 RepID=A0A2V4T415_9BURK|nr:purine nucleoside permease [Paraburkholderia silvatlantica]PYE18402.1 purine nucleoside permease [Paraburkholderia silvatlantica]
MLIRKSSFCVALLLATLISACTSAPATRTEATVPASADNSSFARSGDATHARPVKVMIISMFAPEAQVWLDRLGPWDEIRVAGLASDYPVVRCNRAGVCVMTTGMGHANAAASAMALSFAPQFDLRHTYFLIAGIAGVNPHVGTLGSAAWSKYLVDFGIQWEIDARGAPNRWRSGYLGIHTKDPADKPALHYHTEVFELNARLTDTAFALSRTVTLSDSAQAQTERAKFGYAPADRSPEVIECDSVASDTWWSGTALGERASEWTRLLTDGKGIYCMTQQEDNATYEAFTRAAAAGRVDLSRVAVLRTGSDFDRPHGQESDVDNLFHYADQGGFKPAVENLYRAGNPLVRDIVSHWDDWQAGVPAR